MRYGGQAVTTNDYTELAMPLFFDSSMLLTQFSLNFIKVSEVTEVENLQEHPLPISKHNVSDCSG